MLDWYRDLSTSSKILVASCVVLVVIAIGITVGVFVTGGY